MQMNTFNIKSSSNKARDSLIQEDNQNNEPEERHFDQYVVDDDLSSLGSDASNEGDDDLYLSSVIAVTQVKAPEELVDTDLLNLLRLIKTLPLPTGDEISSKSVQFGDYTRYKTLIFDLDETLIQSHYIQPSAKSAEG